MADARCPVCGHEGEDGARFCATCGAQRRVLSAGGPVSPAILASHRYHAGRILGDGVRKVVYLARDVLLDRDVALAVVRPQGLDDVERTRIEREVHALARLGSHPNVVTLYDVTDLDGATALVFEYLDGGTLLDLLAATGGRGLPIRDAVRIAEQVARALEAVHREGLVFRDLKPGNVLLSGDGTAKLCDFGLAVRPDSIRITSPGVVVGSLSYLAPERIARRSADHRSDLYALGVLAYEMLAGEVPFPGDHPDEVGAQHLHAAPPPLDERRSGLAPALRALVARLLDKDPAKRPPSAAAVTAELAAIRSSLG